MRWFSSVLAMLACLLVAAAPAVGAERFEMSCPTCDHIDAEGHGLTANATLVVVIRDVRTGQRVNPTHATVRTDSGGNFSAEYDVRLADHPAVEGAVYNQDGANLVLAAHTRFSAPAHCLKNGKTLPFTGSRTDLLATTAIALLAAGVVLLLTTRVSGRHGGA
jgi:hypothetical protein